VLQVELPQTPLSVAEITLVATGITTGCSGASYSGQVQHGPHRADRGLLLPPRHGHPLRPSPLRDAGKTGSASDVLLKGAAVGAAVEVVQHRLPRGEEVVAVRVQPAGN
jgi:hypothetical protein